MRGITVVLSAMAVAAVGASARADISASAQATLTSITGPASAKVYHYSIALTNTGDTDIGTFWYAWLPGQDLLSSFPSVTSTPSGWIAPIAGSGDEFDGYSIEWYNYAGSNIAPGHGFTFGFTSADSPAVLTGNSVAHSSYPVQTAFVYPGFPEYDPGYEFILPAPIVAPEPASLGVLGVAVAGLMMRRRGRASA